MPTFKSTIYDYNGLIIRGLAQILEDTSPSYNSIVPHCKGIYNYNQFIRIHNDQSIPVSVHVDILDPKGNIDYTKHLGVFQYSYIMYRGITNFLDHHIHPELETIIKEYKFED